VEPSGRLELTWTNKHLRLITTETGGYDWVEPTDPRVSEVRLLHDVESVGEVAGDVGNNLLIEGDPLHALTALNRIPEFARHYAGQVRLVYIDPPFNTGQAFADYDDNLEHSVWLSMLRDRLVQIKPLLAPNGSIWVHLDDAEVHRCRCVMDEVLGSGNFVATVIWQKIYTVKNTAKHFSVDHDYVVVFAADKTSWQRHLLPRTTEMDVRYSNPDGDPRGPWKAKPLHANKPYNAGLYSVTTPSGRLIEGPPRGSYWRVSKVRLDDQGRLWFGASGDGEPTIKGFRSETREGKIPQTWWPHAEVGSTGTAKNEVKSLLPGQDPFATPKPERLLQRIIHISTDPGDIVLDCFAGSGTTAAVAHKMGRRWFTSERASDPGARFTRPRLEKVVAGEDPGGITAAVEWKGGGGFRHMKVGSSMLDLDAETGEVFLAEWATNGAFSEAVAAQLGFAQVDEPPFCGLKGRTRLAVLDGVVGATEMEFLVVSLGDRERAVVVGKAFTDDAEARLRELSPGSRVRHAPGELLRKGGRR
jgi:adenine-specific DNA-methyltransferase